MFEKINLMGLGLLGLSLTIFASGLQAQTELVYPEAGAVLTGKQIAEQVYAATHGGLVNNALSKRNGGKVALIINRVPLAMRGSHRKPNVQSFDTYVNNRPEEEGVDSVQMAILTNGKAKGMGILFTNYVDKSKSAQINLWLPALRKTRRISEPSHEDTWFGSNLTYGELVLRRPEHEVHELLGEATFDDCLPVMKLQRYEMSRYTRGLPKDQCAHQGKQVYRLKSTTKFEKWWYDYHISDIDTKTFALYRTVYFKDDKKVKTVVVDWQSLGLPDPRITFPRFVYAVSHGDGKDTFVYIPRKTVELDVDLPASFWSVDTMKKYTQRKR